jgi:16S rRNA (adenine1518-N6/adenine1519-N6)-dimethyltransferase
MKVVYVDENDKVIGSGTIADGYAKGIRLRIARIFITNPKGEVLIQKRSDSHKAMPGVWDQSAAGHVDAGESYEEAAERELAEEMGIKNVKLKPLIKYYSEETDEKQFVKKRFNTIFAAEYDGPVKIDQDEVSDFRWIDINELQDWMWRSPRQFTEGFIKALKIYRDNLPK